MAHKGTGMSEGEGSENSHSGEHVTTPVSCVDAFDAVWFCYSPAHQVRHSSLNRRMFLVAQRALPTVSFSAVH